MTNSLFDDGKQKSSYKFKIIFIVLFAVAFGAVYSFWKYAGYTPEVSAEQILEEKSRDAIVMLLAMPRFSGEQFRRQILGDARLQRFVVRKKEVYFSLPESSDAKFIAATDKFIADPQKIDFAEDAGKKFQFDTLSLAKTPQTGYFFKTSLDNLKFDVNKKLEFPFQNATYTLSIKELLDYFENTPVYGGKLAASTNPQIDGKAVTFANHGAMVAKPNEPSLKRFVAQLLRDMPENAPREVKIQKLLDFVSNEIQYDYYEALGNYETLKRPDEVLMSRSSDCSNKTILMASMLEQIGEDYILLYCPRHITVAVPQGDFPLENNLSFEWNSKNWVIAETTLPNFQIGKTKVMDAVLLNTVEYVQNPKLPEIIFEAQTFRPLEFR